MPTDAPRNTGIQGSNTVGNRDGGGGCRGRDRGQGVCYENFKQHAMSTHSRLPSYALPRVSYLVWLSSLMHLHRLMTGCSVCQQLLPVAICPCTWDCIDNRLMHGS